MALELLKLANQCIRSGMGIARSPAARPLVEMPGVLRLTELYIKKLVTLIMGDKRAKVPLPTCFSILCLLLLVM